MRRIQAVLLIAAAIPAWAAQPVRARHGMVVSRERHATQAGLKVLESGGNAVDAAVVVGLALAVTHPYAGNIGGGGFMLLRLADGRTTFIDFRERAPQAASRNMYLDAAGKVTEDSTVGYRASGIPGTVRGLEYASKKYGRKAWAELVHPAVELAAKGFPVSYALAQSLRNTKGLSRFPESARIFQKDGKFWEAGDTFVQPDLARTLERIEKLGAKDFYEGETARLLAKDMAAHGGLITEADLKGYTVKERKPLNGAYHGYSIVTAPPPSSGGVGILQMLGMLEGTGYEKAGAGSATVVHYMTEAMRRYFADRSEHLGDSDFVKVPLTSLLDPKYIAKQRASIDPERATPSSQIKAAVFDGHESVETTHYTIADSEGNIAAVTYTLNGGFGSKVTATGLGFLLNNEMDDFAPKPGEANMYGLVQGEANAIQPGKTPLSSMTPTIVLKDGQPVLALGSPGGPTIINTVLEVIVNVLDFNMNVQDAVNWPRFHHQWMPDVLSVEPGYSPDTVALLEKRGYTVKRAGPDGRVISQGDAAAIRFSNGWLEGAPDPRTEGTAEGH
ncbi:MAG TPA: gamma-glutamyltransferase [Candidatus Acidoferrales bacterium]|jgi:gamma-glutamyltranspeptidase/glutathione hydrolase|nr:gamma-glutamyltransferase [Candidatus Acidoferrales bacterium]